MALLLIVITMGEVITSSHYDSEHGNVAHGTLKFWVRETIFMIAVGSLMIGVNSCFWQGYESRCLKIFHVIMINFFGTIFNAYFLIEIGFRQDGYLMLDLPKEP